MRKFYLSVSLALICMLSSQMIAQGVSQNYNNHFDLLDEDGNAAENGVQWVITDQYQSKVSGVEHIYFRQVLNGLEVLGTESAIHLLPNGKVLSMNNRFIQDISNRTISGVTPSLSAVQAVEAAANRLNYNITQPLTIVDNERTSDGKIAISKGGISLSDIPAQLVYQQDTNGNLILSWDISIQEVAQQNWWSLRINATTGNIVDQNNWMVSCSFDHDHSADDEVLDFHKNLYDIPNYNELVKNNEIGCGECYEVFAMPVESPLFGSRTTEMQPADPTASPFGWHDTDGVAGAEFTVTRGNNTNTYEDGNNPGYQPDGGVTLDFTGFPFDQAYSNATQYEDASLTNLFYWSNIIHDVMYQYGFDEVSGNFQENNYGNGGAGSDSVNSEGQDGSGTCNANFGTPPDGSNPQMQMYVCNDRDGSFDNNVVVHEYGHGISNRLTGGPGNSGCLGGAEQMGEGWSDYFGLMMTIEPGDMGTDPRSQGTYLFGQGPGGPGIRPFPYSTDFAIDPQTYDHIKTAAVPHGVGSVWTTMVWEMTWELIDEHGFDPDIYNFTGDVNLDAGNIQALAIVMEGLKLQPCGPGFVDGRDAILAADQAIYGGANECRIWDAFARRGLGLSADQGSSASNTDGTEAFDTPSGMANFTAPKDVCEGSAVLTGLGGGSPFGGEYSGPGVTDDGNGSTYSFDPVAAGPGIHTISYEVQDGTCSVASTDTDDIEVISIDVGPVTTDHLDVCLGAPATVTATPNDPTNVIFWYDAVIDGNFLFEGESYTFNTVGNTTVYAQERPAPPVSKLVVSELTFETPDRLEIQNVGAAFDYTGYAVGISDQPYSDINTMNPNVAMLGNMGADSVVDFNDQAGSPEYWGSNIWWGSSGNGWVIIVDPSGDVVDSAFWNFSEAQIAALNVTINGFNITANDLDWIGDGADLSVVCNNSFRRNGDSDLGTDWPNVCTPADYGTPNGDIGDVSGNLGCLAERSPADVTTTPDTEAPVVTCPADITVTVNPGELYTVPDYSGMVTVTDNCTASPVVSQNPAIGATVPEGTTVVTMSATDVAGNVGTCTFNLIVDSILGTEEEELNRDIVLFPNPTSGELTLSNNSNQELISIVISDVNGRTIKTIDLTDAGVNTQISVENFATGLYFVQINAVEGSIVKRIVKK